MSPHKLGQQRIRGHALRTCNGQHPPSGMDGLGASSRDVKEVAEAESLSASATLGTDLHRTWATPSRFRLLARPAPALVLRLPAMRHGAGESATRHRCCRQDPA